MKVKDSKRLIIIVMQTKMCCDVEYVKRATCKSSTKKSK